MVYVGTSGWQYSDWVGYFYPKGMKPSQFLSYYSKFFSTVEINSTYYKIPNEEVFAKIGEKVPKNFIFSVKANQIFTHKREYTKNDVSKFIRAIRNINYKVILFQFPHSFHLTKENLRYALKIREDFKDENVVVEMRSIEWFRDDIIKTMERYDINMASVDEPDIPGLAPRRFVIHKIGYIRFHGRRADRWYEHKKPEERYDYLYSIEELQPWAEKVKDENREVFVFFNNHPRAQAVKNAQDFIKLLRN